MLLLFPGVGSVEAAEIVAVFDSVPGTATGGALKVSVIEGAAPTARLGAVHVTTPATLLHVQPVPAALTKVAPAGSVSETETLAAGAGRVRDRQRVGNRVTAEGRKLAVLMMARSAARRSSSSQLSCRHALCIRAKCRDRGGLRVAVAFVPWRWRS